jgi:bifunctional non-homologous end joining protein LigD
MVALDEDGKPSHSIPSMAPATEPQVSVPYAFDLLMLCGRDVRLPPLEARRDQLREVIQHLPDAVWFSETFNVPPSQLIRAMRENQLEGIIAKRAGNPIPLLSTMRRLAKVESQSRQPAVTIRAPGSFLRVASFFEPTVAAMQCLGARVPDLNIRPNQVFRPSTQPRFRPS